MGNRDLLDFYFWPNSRPVGLPQFFLELFHLPTRRTYQIVPATFTDGGQILLAHDAAIADPDPAGLTILALHHAQNGFQGRDIGAVAVKSFVAEREPFTIDNQRDHHLLTVGPMVPRIATAHHGILFRRTFHIGAGQIVEQHIKLGPKQRSIALLEVSLQPSLVRQNAIQAAIQAGVIDLAFFDSQQIIQGCPRIPTLFDGQLAAGRA